MTKTSRVYHAPEARVVVVFRDLGIAVKPPKEGDPTKAFPREARGALKDGRYFARVRIWGLARSNPSHFFGPPGCVGDIYW